MIKKRRYTIEQLEAEYDNLRATLEFISQSKYLGVATAGEYKGMMRSAPAHSITEMWGNAMVALENNRLRGYLTTLKNTNRNRPPWSDHIVDGEYLNPEDSIGENE